MSVDEIGHLSNMPGMDAHSLISRIEAYCAASGYTPGTVGLKAVNNSRLYERLRDGGSCTLETAGRLLEWLASNPPANINIGQKSNDASGVEARFISEAAE